MTTTHASRRRRHWLYLSTCPRCSLWVWTFKGFKRHWNVCE